MREFGRAKRVVIKAGTSILTTPAGRLVSAKINRLGADILAAMKQNRQAVLVSSGAIGFGMNVRGFKQRPRKMGVLQACAAIGQGKLIHAYEQYFSRRGVHTAQILLTRDGLEQRDRFLNARHTLEELLSMKVLSIVNENDTVSTDEIRFGDNDILAVHVAHLIHADLLINLSDVDGFFLKDGSRVREVTNEEEIDRNLVRHLKKKVSRVSVGGMKSKLEAARAAMRLGLPMILVSGHTPKVISKVLNGADVGTYFSSQKTQKNAREKWIAFSSARRGSLKVDDGAYQALKSGSRSLLASGITQVRGRFQPKEVVELETPSGKVFGRGIVRYGNEDLNKISGKKSSEIKNMFLDRYHGEVIHRNDLVLWA